MHDLIPIDKIMADVKVPGGAAQIWHILAAVAAKDTNLPPDYIASRLVEQETRNSSGIGNGVAIPHLRLRKLTRPYTLFARAPRRVAINAVDGQDVDLFFLLLSPAGDVPGHLRRLSRLSRLVRDETLRDQLRGAGNEDGLQALFLASPDMTLAA